MNFNKFERLDIIYRKKGEKMKKVLFTVFFVLSFWGCGGDGRTDPQSSKEVFSEKTISAVEKEFQRKLDLRKKEILFSFDTSFDGLFKKIIEDGKYIITSKDKTTYIYNYKTKKLISTFDGWLGKITEDGKYIITSQDLGGSKYKTYIYNYLTGKLISTFDGFFKKITENGKYIINSDWDSTYIYNYKTKKLISTFNGRFKKLIEDGKYVITFNHLNEIDDKTYIYNIKTKKLISTFDGKFKKITDDEKYIIISDSCNSIYIYNIQKEKLLSTFDGRFRKIAEDGKYLIASSLHLEKTYIYNFQTKKLISTFKGEFEKITGDGKYIVTSQNLGSWEKQNYKTFIYHIQTEKLISTFDGYFRKITEDRKFLITCNNRYLSSVKTYTYIYNFQTKKLISTFDGYFEQITENKKFLITSQNLGTQDKPNYKTYIYNYQNKKDLTYFFPNNKPYHSKNLFQDTAKLSQNLVNIYLEPRTIPKEKVPLKIQKPTLPPLPKFTKEEFETKAMFQNRVNLAIQNRKEKIEELQTKYRKDVESRNNKIREIKREIKAEQKFKKSILPQKITQFQKEAFEYLTGGFTFEKKSYDAETETMYLTMKAKNSDYSKKISVQVPLNIAKSFTSNIDEVLANPIFDFQQNQIVLKKIEAKFQGKTMLAKLSDTDFKPEKIMVAIKDTKADFNGIEQIDLTLQNPNLLTD